MPDNVRNAEDIKELEKKLDEYKDIHAKEHIDIATSLGGLNGTLSGFNNILKDIKKDTADTKTETLKIVPVVNIISEIEIPQLKKEQKDINKWRWKTVGSMIIIIFLASAIITGLITYMFNKLNSEKYIERSKIENIYKFTESLSKEAEANTDIPVPKDNQ